MNPTIYNLFDGYGIELEYMLVDKNTLEVKPITDELIRNQLGIIGSDFENGIVTWSNELVLHVIEIKSTKPESDLEALDKAFLRNITLINSILDQWDTMLLPAAAHPFMNPLQDTKLWPHDNNEVYELYDKIFDSKGHGWSNLQSTHLNLPFHGDEEFAKLHAAIRIILPLLPALCASSPILDGKNTGLLDTRLYYYKTNQAKIPSITGSIVPEAVFSFADYRDTIYKPIEKGIAYYNEAKILDPVWVNSRGAIARFDRGSIEIRIMDIQECPAMDLAIVYVIVETLKALIAEKFIPLSEQKKVDTRSLSDILDRAMVAGRHTKVSDPGFLSVFGLSSTATLRDVWEKILPQLPATNDFEKGNIYLVNQILQKGSLSERILQSLGEDHSRENIITTYRKLAVCLAEGKMFMP